MPNARSGIGGKKHYPFKTSVSLWDFRDGWLVQPVTLWDGEGYIILGVRDSLNCVFAPLLSNEKLFSAAAGVGSSKTNTSRTRVATELALIKIVLIIIAPPG